MNVKPSDCSETDSQLHDPSSQKRDDCEDLLSTFRTLRKSEIANAGAFIRHGMARL